jgi:hypothetical protein
MNFMSSADYPDYQVVERTVKPVNIRKTEAWTVDADSSEVMQIVVGIGRDMVTMSPDTTALVSRGYA